MASITTTRTTTPGQKTNLTDAHRQWAERPADQRFWTVDDLHAAAMSAEANRATAIADMSALRVELDGHNDIALLSPDGSQRASFTHWSFGQLCSRINAPAAYLRSLPAEMVANLINHGLECMGEDGREARLSLRTDGGTPLVEAFTSERYSYISNVRIAEGLKVLQGMGWKVPPARVPWGGCEGVETRIATEADVLQHNGISWGVQVGDTIAPSGLYASDHDLFGFMVHETAPIDDNGNPLRRGIMVKNSVVGAGAFELTVFLYDGICGNHIVWGASDVAKVRIRHIGQADERAFAALEGDLGSYLNQDPSEQIALIAACRSLELGADKEQTVQAIFDKRSIGLSRKVLERSFDLCEELDGDRVNPCSAWGVVTGLTRLSQEGNFADERSKLDAASAKIMALAN